MPIYEYFCGDCEQVFTTIRPVTEYQQPSECPACGKPSERVIASAPRLNTMRPDIRKAHQVNEKSAHEPRMSRKHSCGSGCGCGQSTASKTRESNTPDLKQQAGKRPWMLGH